MNAPLKGWHVLAAMLTFFGVVIAINVGFTVAAIRSFPGEDEQRSYLQGLHYNDMLAERRAQRALGWRAFVTFRGDGARSLVVVVRSRGGAPIDGLDMNAMLGRRSSAASDHALAFIGEGGGVYVAALPPLAPGQWRLRAHAANDEGDALDFESDLTWPSL